MIFSPASSWRRAGAAAIDAAIAFMPCWLIAPFLVALTAGTFNDESQFVLRFVVQLNALVSLLIYAARPVILYLFRRPTLGERLMGTAVARDAPGFAAVSRTRFIVRQVAKMSLVLGCLLSGMYPLLLIDGLWSLVDRRGRCLHDVIAGTVVMSADGSVVIEDAQLVALQTQQTSGAS
jgi:uncharacterized RDD family membrane protein YckC